MEIHRCHRRAAPKAARSPSTRVSTAAPVQRAQQPQGGAREGRGWETGGVGARQGASSHSSGVCDDRGSERRVHIGSGLRSHALTHTRRLAPPLSLSLPWSLSVPVKPGGAASPHPSASSHPLSLPLPLQGSCSLWLNPSKSGPSLHLAACQGAAAAATHKPEETEKEAGRAT